MYTFIKNNFRFNYIPWELIIIFFLCTVAGARILTLKIGTDEQTRIDYLNPGEALWYGIPISSSGNTISWHLPFSSLTAAVLYGYNVQYLNQFLSITMAALFTGLCTIIYSPALAIVALPLWYISTDSIRFPQSILTLLIFVVSGLLVVKERHPSRINTWAVALSIGTTLLFRSTLAFFPPLLALLEIASCRKRKISIPKMDILILLLVPYLFLLPWIGMNFLLYKKFIPFEYGEANSNIITGALGFIGTAEGIHKLPAHLPLLTAVPLPKSNVLPWAIKEILNHPFLYTEAILLRIIRVIGWNPILFLLAAIGLLSFHNQKPIGTLVLLATYLLAIHCLMSIEFDYFTPLRPLLAIFAALLFVFFMPSIGEKLGTRIFQATLIILLILCFAVWYRVLLYPSAIKSPNALDLALSRNPNNAWLLHEKGMRLLSAGNAQTASAYLLHAANSSSLASYSLDSAWAFALCGHTRDLMDWGSRLQEYTSPAIIEEAYIRKSLISFALKRYQKGRIFLNYALMLYVSQAFIRNPANSSEIAATKSLRLMVSETFSKRALATPGLNLLAPSVKTLFIHELKINLSAKAPGLNQSDENGKIAITSLPPDYVSASYFSHPQEYLHQLALSIQDYKILRDLARRILKFLVVHYPNNEVYLRDLAVCEYLMNAHEKAIIDLKSALQLNSHDPSAYLSLEAVESIQGHIRSARKACKDALANIAYDFQLSPVVYATCRNLE